MNETENDYWQCISLLLFVHPSLSCFMKGFNHLEGLLRKDIIWVSSCPWLRRPGLQTASKDVNVEEDILLLREPCPVEVHHQLPENIRRTAYKHHCNEKERENEGYRHEKKL